MHKFLFLIVILLNGCASSNFITKLTPPGLHNGQSPDHSLCNYSSIDDLKKKHFTKDAYEAIKNIPTIDGNIISPFVSGVNLWSNIASFILFNGIGPKVIVSKQNISRNILIHEYTHHLDYLDRAKIGEFINRKEFEIAFLKMMKDPVYKQKMKHIRRKSNKFITNVFGIGTWSEEIAYVSSFLIEEGGPEYMWKVFSKILNKP